MIIIETPFMAECYRVLGFYRQGDDEGMAMALAAELEAQDDDAAFIAAMEVENQAMQDDQDAYDQASYEAERGTGSYIPFSDEQENERSEFGFAQNEWL